MEARNDKCNLTFAICVLQLAIFFSGCSAFQVGGEIQPGRYALMSGNPKVALAHFQHAAERDPNYITDFTFLRQGVWTYVGRAHYALGQLPDAQKALQQARSRHQEDDLAKLYLGLVLTREGDREKGRGEIEAGLAGLNNWLDYMDRYHPDGRFWDPGRDLRSEIQRDLTMISAKDIKWPELVASGEWLGQQFEREIDESRRQKLLENRDGRRE